MTVPLGAVAPGLRGIGTGSLSTRSTPSYVATDQNPSPSGVWTVGSCHHTGASSRCSRKTCAGSPREGVEIGQVDLPRSPTTGPSSLRSAARSRMVARGRSPMAEAGRLNRPQ